MLSDFEQARDLFVQGAAHFEAGRLDAAASSFEASLRLLPGRVSTLTNLAATQLALGQPEAALASVAQALASAPDDPNAWWQRGLALSALGRPVEALAAFERLGAIAPDHLGGWMRQAQTLQQLDRREPALAAVDRALALDPKDAPAWSLRGSLLKDLQRRDEAATAFRQALALGGDPELHAYFLAAVTGQPAPPSAPAQYVRGLFDGYADSFDRHLMDVLRYQAPGVLVHHLRSLAGDTRFRQALDLGCGTGLCGPLARALADRVDGVDLSPTMLDKARALHVYTDLAQDDVVAHLQTTPQRYDLVLAADVFIYIGDLAPVFAGVARVVDPGGLFCFSIEAPEGHAQDFALKTSLRYGQSVAYVRALAERHGFDVAKLVYDTIREDQGVPIDGAYCYLRRR